MKGDEGISITDSYVESIIENTCNTGNAYDNDLFYCIKKSSIDKELTEERFLQAFNIQYMLARAKHVNDTFKIIESNFTTYLISYG